MVDDELKASDRELPNEESFIFFNWVTLDMVIRIVLSLRAYDMWTSQIVHFKCNICTYCHHMLIPCYPILYRMLLFWVFYLSGYSITSSTFQLIPTKIWCTRFHNWTHTVIPTFLWYIWYATEDRDHMMWTILYGKYIFERIYSWERSVVKRSFQI